MIFLTDGRPTIGTTDEDQIVANVKKENDGHTRVFCFGIGTDVNTHLLDRITEDTRAVSQYVLPEEDLEVKVSNFFSKIKEPVLANPTLKFTGGIRATKLYPSPLPDLFKGEQLVLVGTLLRQGRCGGHRRRHRERRGQEVHLRSEISRTRLPKTSSSRASGRRGASATCWMKSGCTARTPSCATR